MNNAQQNLLNSLYQQHVSALHRQGKAKTTIDVYSRAVRRITEFFDQPLGSMKLHSVRKSGKAYRLLNTCRVIYTVVSSVMPVLCRMMGSTSPSNTKTVVPER